MGSHCTKTTSAKVGVFEAVGSRHGASLHAVPTRVPAPSLRSVRNNKSTTRTLGDPGPNLGQSLTVRKGTVMAIARGVIRDAPSRMDAYMGSQRRASCPSCASRGRAVQRHPTQPGAHATLAPFHTQRRWSAPSVDLRHQREESHAAVRAPVTRLAFPFTHPVRGSDAMDTSAATTCSGSASSRSLQSEHTLGQSLTIEEGSDADSARGVVWGVPGVGLGYRGEESHAAAPPHRAQSGGIRPLARLRRSDAMLRTAWRALLRHRRFPCAPSARHSLRMLTSKHDVRGVVLSFRTCFVNFAGVVVVESQLVTSATPRRASACCAVASL